jgi:hypothetical protein
MALPMREFEGTWEQIAAQVGDLGEQRVRVLIFPMAETQPTTPDTRPINEILAEIAASVPPEEVAKLPPDFTSQLDHYIYGSPKR